MSYRGNTLHRNNGHGNNRRANNGRSYPRERSTRAPRECSTLGHCERNTRDHCGILHDSFRDLQYGRSLKNGDEQSQPGPNPLRIW